MAYIVLWKLCRIYDVDGLTKHLVGTTLVMERL